MKAYRWNGERWYEDRRSLVGHVRQWFFWSGGWEAHGPKRVNRRGPDWTLRERLNPEMLAPVSILGHRLTYFSWGINWHTRNGVWVWAWKMGPRRLYRSYNGTPSGADLWLLGTPKDIVQAARDAAHLIESKVGV